MPMIYEKMMGLAPRVTRHSYTERDTILYALGVGAGIAPDLQHVYEDGLRALPTMAVVLASPGFWLKDPEHGVDWRRVLHGEQMLTLHRELPVAGEVRGELTIDEIYDKGPDKGAVLYSSRRLYDDATGILLATLRQSSFLRGDGGSGGPASGAPKPAAAAEGAPDTTVDLSTRPEQALIYRLSGDYNPLHADPIVATHAGFRAPILHGLCTYGVAARAVASAAIGAGKGGLQRFDVRFSSPVYPGETLRTDIWWERSSALFRTWALERNQLVLTNGFAEFA